MELYTDGCLLMMLDTGLVTLSFHISCRRSMRLPFGSNTKVWICWDVPFSMHLVWGSSGMHGLILPLVWLETCLDTVCSCLPVSSGGTLVVSSLFDFSGNLLGCWTYAVACKSHFSSHVLLCCAVHDANSITCWFCVTSRDWEREDTGARESAVTLFVLVHRLLSFN